MPPSFPLFWPLILEVFGVVLSASVNMPRKWWCLSSAVSGHRVFDDVLVPPSTSAKVRPFGQISCVVKLWLEFACVQIVNFLSARAVMRGPATRLVSHRLSTWYAILFVFDGQYLLFAFCEASVQATFRIIIEFTLIDDRILCQHS
jgi:hypothetical protein